MVPRGLEFDICLCENNVNNYFYHQKFGNLNYLIQTAFLGTLHVGKLSKRHTLI